MAYFFKQRMNMGQPVAHQASSSDTLFGDESHGFMNDGPPSHSGDRSCGFVNDGPPSHSGDDSCRGVTHSKDKPTRKEKVVKAIKKGDEGVNAAQDAAKSKEKHLKTKYSKLLDANKFNINLIRELQKYLKEYIENEALADEFPQTYSKAFAAGYQEGFRTAKMQ